jgi:DNA repair protein RadC
VSNLSTKEECLNRIDELNNLFKIKSQELVECTSLAKEMKIKEEMSLYEVQKRVVKRKLATLELEDEISA